MTTFFAFAAAAILFTVCIGLVRVLLGPTRADRLMAAQLVGSGGIGALLLAIPAFGLAFAADLALVLAVLTPITVIGVHRGMAAARPSGMQVETETGGARK